jgi:hypothetical protein
LAAENLMIAAVAAQPNLTGNTTTNMSLHHVKSIIEHFLTISCQNFNNISLHPSTNNS